MQQFGLTKYVRPSKWHQNASASKSLSTDQAGTQEYQQPDIE